MPVSANTPWMVMDPDETAGKLRRSQLAAQIIHERMIEQQAQASHVEVRFAAGGWIRCLCDLSQSAACDLFFAHSPAY